VCWFLGFSPQHDHGVFETRAANDELLPSLDDEVTLEVELEELDFEHRVSPDLRRLVAQAEQFPNQPQQATVGALLRLDVCVELLIIEDDAISDLTIIVLLPPVTDGATAPPDWSDAPLLERLVALIDPRRTVDQVDWAPTSVPTGPAEEGSTHRAVDPARELAVRVPNRPA